MTKISVAEANSQSPAEESADAGGVVSPGGVRAVSRALSILSAFASNPGPISLSALARATALDKGTTRRLLLTLVQSEFVALDPRTQGYILGPRILSLAGTVTSYRELRDLVRPILVRLGDETGTTIHLSQERKYEAVCIERYQSARASIVFPHWSVGGRTMLNSGAAPWLLLAGMSNERIDAMLADSALRALLAPPVDPVEIKRVATEYRTKDWALSVNEVADGLTALAVPIRTINGKTLAAISLVGLTPEMIVAGKPRHLQQALDAAHEAGVLVMNASPSQEGAL